MTGREEKQNRRRETLLVPAQWILQLAIKFKQTKNALMPIENISNPE